MKEKIKLVKEVIVHKNISLRNAGIIAGAAAIFAFLFGIIITTADSGLPNFAAECRIRTEQTQHQNESK